MILSSLTASKGWSQSQVGFFASSYMAGAMVSTLASVLWIRRLSWRVAVLAGALSSALGLWALMGLENFGGVLVLIFAVGSGHAAMAAPAVAAISDTDSTSRNFAVLIMVQVAMAAILAACIPAIDETWAFAGILAVLALASLVSAGSIFWLPVRGLRGDAAQADASPQKGSKLAVFLGLIGLLVFYCAITAVWSFAGLFAESWNMAEGQIAGAVSLSLMLGVGGALAAAFLGERIRAISAILVGILGVGVSWLMFTVGGGYLLFTAALVLMNCLWNFGAAYQAGMISSLDFSGRFAVLITAAQTAGAVIGPGLMGVVLESTQSFNTGLALAGIGLGLSHAFYYAAHRRYP